MKCVRFKCCFHQLRGRGLPSHGSFDWPNFPEGEDTECPNIGMDYYAPEAVVLLHTHYCQRCCQDGLHDFYGLGIYLFTSANNKLLEEWLIFIYLFEIKITYTKVRILFCHNRSGEWYVTSLIVCRYYNCIDEWFVISCSHWT